MTFKGRKKKVKTRTTLTSRTLPKNFIPAFGKELRLKATKETREFAQELAAEAKDVILEQRYNWEPLTDEYLARKEKQGLDRRIYIATRAFIDKGIGYYEKRGYSFVGPLPGIHEPSGLTFARLARILEFGTWSIPARPIWRPLLSVALRRSKEFRKTFQLAAKKDFDKKVKRSTKKTTRKA